MQVSQIFSPSDRLRRPWTGLHSDCGLVSFAQNKIASLRKICVNLRIAAGLFTNSSYHAYLRKHVKFTHLVCDCTRVSNLWLYSKFHSKLFSFFRDWHNNHRLLTYGHQQKIWVNLTCFRRYASQDEVVKRFANSCKSFCFGGNKQKTKHSEKGRNKTFKKHVRHL